MRRLGKRRFRAFGGQKGFTLVEVLVAVAILGVIGTGLLSALQTQSRGTRVLDEQVTAVNLAAAHVEAIKDSTYSADPDSYPNASDNITIPFQYTVTVNTECSSDGTTFGPCTGSVDETFQRIVISVSREGRPVFSQCTYRTKR